MSSKIKILFLGDLVGRPGRYAARKYLQENHKNYDFVIANAENASHGYGLTKKNYEDLLSYGINALTSGNHIWDRKEIFEYIKNAERLIRPLNFPEGSPGVGSRIIKTEGDLSIGIINILGVVFMSPLAPPWQLLEQETEKLKKETSVIIIDCHAEATAEKVSCGYISAGLGVSAVIGTHTHVQTADEKIIENTTAYITDAGFCGSYKSVIGMDVESSVKRLVKALPLRLEVGPMERVQINGVEIIIDSNTGCAEKIKRINEVFCLESEVS